MEALKTEYKSVRETKVSRIATPGNSHIVNKSIKAAHPTGVEDPEVILLRKIITKIQVLHLAEAVQPETSSFRPEQAS